MKIRNSALVKSGQAEADLPYWSIETANILFKLSISLQIYIGQLEYIFEESRL